MQISAGFVPEKCRRDEDYCRRNAGEMQIFAGFVQTHRKQPKETLRHPKTPKDTFEKPKNTVLKPISWGAGEAHQEDPKGTPGALAGYSGRMLLFCCLSVS
jgi:hypothetical protein